VNQQAASEGLSKPLIEARAAPPERGLSWGRLDLFWLAVIAAAAAAGMLRAQGAFSYDWNWSSVWPYVIKVDPQTGQWAPNLLPQGLMTTLRLAIWAMVIALAIGLVMGWMRGHPRLLFRLVSTSYVMTVRNIPPVVLSSFSSTSLPASSCPAWHSISGWPHCRHRFRMCWPCCSGRRR